MANILTNNGIQMPAFQRERRHSVADELYERMINQHESFWTVVYPLFMNRDINRTIVRSIIWRGLEETRGSYKQLTVLLGMEVKDYKRFLNFLRKHRCQLPFMEARARFIELVNVVDPKVKAPDPPLAPPAPAPKFSAPPPPPAPKSVPAPTPEPVEQLKNEEMLKLSRTVLLTLFYSGGQPHVNLSHSRLQDTIPNGWDVDLIVRNAIRLAKDHWRMTPQGSEAKQKFIRLMHRFRHNFSNSAKFEDALKFAMKQDNSSDPVSL